MCKFSEDSKVKLGNAAIYIAEHTKQLSKTKLLKLLYFMEERMIVKYNVPFLALPFEVWQAGPVAKDVFVDLSDGPFLLKDYVTVSNNGEGAMFVYPLKAFSDEEFSDCEISLMDEVLEDYGNMSAKELVKESHKEGGLWYIIAKEKGLYEAFLNHQCNSSDVVIDFSRMLAKDAAERYRESLAIHQTANLLKLNGNV